MLSCLVLALASQPTHTLDVLVSTARLVALGARPNLVPGVVYQSPIRLDVYRGIQYIEPLRACITNPRPFARSVSAACAPGIYIPSVVIGVRALRKLTASPTEASLAVEAVVCVRARLTRSSFVTAGPGVITWIRAASLSGSLATTISAATQSGHCLLYTSDAADE